jgi:3-dehydroquinate synthase class II
MKALASKHKHGRTWYLVDDRNVKKGDNVLIETEDGAVRATIVNKSTFSLAVQRSGGDGGG